MQIVGIEHTGRDSAQVDTAQVHTIDMWFSERRGMWFVERLDADGNQIGVVHRCGDEQEASACLDEWLRTHSETHLLAPRETTAAEKRLLAGRSRRQAA